jgi:hypothetical protein
VRVADRVRGDRQQVDPAPLEWTLPVEPGQQDQLFDQQSHPGRLVLDPAHGLVQQPAGRCAAPAVQLGEPADGGQRGT